MATDMIAEDDEFDDRLFRTVCNVTKSNLILSPLSILIAMTVCMSGAKTYTLEEMLDVLYPNHNHHENATKITKNAINLCHYYNTKYHQNPLIKIANKIWIKKGTKILKSYIKDVGTESIENIDISQAANIINQWVAKNTKNMIRKLIPSSGIDSNTEMLIANAIYFNGKFQTPFNVGDTKKNIPFYSGNTRIRRIHTVSMMSSRMRQQYYTRKVISENY